MAFVTCYCQKEQRQKRIQYGIDQIDEQLDVIRFIRNQVAFERYLKVNVSPLQQHYLFNDPALVLNRQKSKAKEQQIDHEMVRQEIVEAEEETIEQMRLRKLKAQAREALYRHSTKAERIQLY